MAFDPDEYLKTSESSFNPDEYLEEPSSGPSELESLARGVAQGATFGFSDELTGAGEAVGKAVFGNDKLSDLMDNYRKYRDESRVNYDAAEKANPASYMTGDIAAGVGTGLLTGGAGALANLGRVGVKQGVKELAKVGARQGAASATGLSDAELTQGEVGELAQDTLTGAALGGTLGATLPIAGKAAMSGAKVVGSTAMKPLKLVTDSRFGQSIKDAYALGTKGKSTVGIEGEKQFQESLIKNAKEVISTYDKQMKEGSKMIGKAISVADQQNAPKNYSNQLNKVKKTLETKSDSVEEYKKMLKQLDDLRRTYQKQTTESGQDQAMKKIQQMQDKMQSVANELGEDVSFSNPEIFKGQSGDLMTFNTKNRRVGSDGQVEDIVTPRNVVIPDDKVTTETLEGFGSASIQDLQNAKGNLQELAYGSRSLGDLSVSGAKDASRQIDSLIKQSIPENVRPYYNRGNELRTLGYEAKDLAPSLGQSTEEKRMSGVINKLLSESRGSNIETEGLMSRLVNKSPELNEEVSDLNIWKNLVKPQDFNLGQGPVNIALGGSKGLSTNLANMAGGVVKNAKEVVENSLTAAGKVKPPKFIKAISEASDEQLQNIIARSKASNNKVSQHLGNSLEAAMQSEGAKRNALMWSITQQPAFREELENIINDMLPEETQN